MSLHCMVYVSIAKQEMTDKQLQDLLKKARENNERSAITGMLLYRDGFFIQAIEGEKKVLENLYAIIAKDERHWNLILIHDEPIEKRSFPDWTMGFDTIDDHNIEFMKGYTDFLQRPTPEDFSHYANQVSIFLDRFRH